MKLTCVTATFNVIAAGNREHLIRCVESVARIKIEHEHLIYDGASTDGTVELLRDLEARVPGVKVVSERDSGIYNALNKGVRDAKGEWFYVLGSDDYICSAETMDKLIADRGSVSCDQIVAPVERDGVRYQFHRFRDLRIVFRWMPYCHQGVIMRTDLVRKYHGFDEGYRICADYDLCFQIHQHAERIRYVFTPFANFAIGGVCDQNMEALIDEYNVVLKRHLGLSAAEIVALRQTNCIPLRVLKRYLFHRDLALRLAAWWHASSLAKRCMLRVVKRDW